MCPCNGPTRQFPPVLLNKAGRSSRSLRIEAFLFHFNTSPLSLSLSVTLPPLHHPLPHHHRLSFVLQRPSPTRRPLTTQQRQQRQSSHRPLSPSRSCWTPSRPSIRLFRHLDSWPSTCAGDPVYCLLHYHHRLFLCFTREGQFRSLPARNPLKLAQACRSLPVFVVAGRRREFVVKLE